MTAPSWIDSIRELLFVDPVTDDELEIAGGLEITDDCDGAWFIVRNPKTGAQWKHTIRTEEA